MASLSYQHYHLMGVCIMLFNKTGQIIGQREANLKEKVLKMGCSNLNINIHKTEKFTKQEKRSHRPKKKCFARNLEIFLK